MSHSTRALNISNNFTRPNLELSAEGLGPTACLASVWKTLYPEMAVSATNERVIALFNSNVLQGSNER